MSTALILGPLQRSRAVLPLFEARVPAGFPSPALDHMVLLLDLCGRDEYTPDLFAPEQPVKTERLMSTLDAINGRWGRGTLQPGRLAKTVEWSMRRELLSPAYTTRWGDLLKVDAR